MARELGGVHALDGGDAVGEVAGLGHAQGVLKRVGALGEPGEEEVGGGIAGTLAGQIFSANPASSGIALS